MIFPHVDIKPSRSWNLLELTLGTGCTPDVVEPSNNLEHRCQCHLAGIPTKTSMWTNSVVNIDIHGPVQAYRVRLREVLGLAISANLREISVIWYIVLTSTQATYEAAKHLVTRLHGHLPAVVING